MIACHGGRDGVRAGLGSNGVAGGRRTALFDTFRQVLFEVPAHSGI